MLDSGASCNTIDNGSFNNSQQSKLISLEPSSAKTFAYGTQNSVKLKGVSD